MADYIKSNKCNVVLIQIDEAHSSAWPMALDDQPEPQKTFQERVDRANKFVKKYDPPFDVYVDGWDDTFSKLFRAWPDKYHCVDSNLRVIAKSEYGTEGDSEAVVTEDYTDLFQRLIERN